MSNTATYLNRIKGKSNLRLVQVVIGTINSDVDVPINVGNQLVSDDATNGQLQVVAVIPPQSSGIVNATFTSKSVGNVADYNSGKIPISGSQLTGMSEEVPVFVGVDGHKISVQTDVACTFNLIVKDLSSGYEER